jgi:xylan 1,4-beta-xylosidase
MFGMMGNERVRLTSSAASPNENVLNPGNAKIEGINGFATRKEREVEVLVWNYQEEDVRGPSATMSLSIAGLPETAKKAKMERFRVDQQNGNAYTAWQKMGRPEKPSGTQYAELEAAGQLKMDGSPESVELDKGKYELRLELPRQGLALVRLTW